MPDETQVHHDYSKKYPYKTIRIEEGSNEKIQLTITTRESDYSSHGIVHRLTKGELRGLRSAINSYLAKDTSE